MKIATWNIERLKAGSAAILNELERYDADIIVLTETGTAINLGAGYNHIHTDMLPAYHDDINYKNELRTSIWSKFNIVNTFQTYDNYTSICAKVNSSNELIKIYGTIIGTTGGSDKRFASDLDNTINDLKKLNPDDFICIAGDFNSMLSGYAYPSHKARNSLNAVFEELKITCPTAVLENNVCHIALSDSYLKDKNIIIETWNEDKKLSDHIGICLTIE